MQSLSFYRQARIDGGVRTGVDWGDTSLLHFFEPGNDDEDPVLNWAIDLVFESRKLPLDPEEARQWLIAREKEVVAALLKVSEELKVGIDASAWPLHLPLLGLPRGIKGKVICIARRREDGRQISTHVRQLARSWKSVIGSLPAEMETAS
ncbi:MAG TPA: hypothetical protein VJ783_27740 [Pirellulales bacterium]|nr:hypothetical protein [Pirellulales bacterium]